MLADFGALRQHYGVILGCVRLQRTRITRYEAELRTTREDIENTRGQLEESEASLRTTRKKLAATNARIVTLNARPSTDASVEACCCG